MDFSENDYRQLRALGWQGEWPHRYSDLRPSSRRRTSPRTAQPHDAALALPSKMPESGERK